MKFKIDENLPIELASILNDAGHDALTIHDENLGGYNDPDISIICKNEARTLITLDLDFSDIRVYPPDEYPGIIVFRVHRQDKPFVIGILDKLLPLFEKEDPQSHLWIVEENQVRIR
ncbi:DUF5615 family PIN-like protein [Candidatus Sumerlaeota bacterium]|nr:DUF5615 family PIN-like protein [Candidatus Sumerlaeota bacterium]